MAIIRTCYIQKYCPELMTPEFILKYGAVSGVRILKKYDIEEDGSVKESWSTRHNRAMLLTYDLAIDFIERKGGSNPDRYFVIHQIPCIQAVKDLMFI